MGKENEKKLEEQQETPRPNYVRILREKIEAAINEYRPQIKKMITFMDEFSKVTMEDNKVKMYTENPYFWQNVRYASKQFINIPVGVSEDVLDYLCQEAFDVTEFKRILGDSDSLLLKEILLEPEYDDYKFNEYLLGILKACEDHPESFRLYIPALFMIVEGTLGEVFKVSEKGMSAEIKRKMSMTWDLYQHIYINQFIGNSGTFWMHLFLTNAKEIFIQLTTSSKKDNLIINRNEVLHGKSDPKEWTEEDFKGLISLIKTILIARKTTQSLMSYFLTIVEDDFYDKNQLVFAEYEERLQRRHPNMKNMHDNKRDMILNQVKKEMVTDLSELSGSDSETAKAILEKSDCNEIISRLKGEVLKDD